VSDAELMAEAYADAVRLADERFAATKPAWEQAATLSESVDIQLQDRYDNGYIAGARNMEARVKALLTMLVDEGHATPEAQRQVLRLWEKEQ